MYDADTYEIDEQTIALGILKKKSWKCGVDFERVEGGNSEEFEHSFA